MATKSKNINKRIKALSILLVIFVFISSLFCTITIYFTNQFFNNSSRNFLDYSNKSFVDSKRVYDKTDEIIYTLSYLSSKNYISENDEQIDSLYEQNKDSDGFNVFLLSECKSLRYYAINKSTGGVLSNFKSGESISSFLDNHLYSFQIVNNTINISPKMNSAYHLISSERNIDIYAYFDVDDSGNLPTNYNDELANAIRVSSKIKNINIMITFVIAVAFGLISFAIIILLIILNSKNDNSKLICFDYIPIDIKLALIGACAFISAFLDCEFLIDKNMLLSFLLIAFGITALILFISHFVLSIIRLTKNKRKWYKCFIITYIPYVVIKNKTIRKYAKNVKCFFTKKLDSFSKTVKLYIAMFILINLALSILLFVCVYTLNNLLAVIILILLAVFNIVYSIYATRYLFILDKMISSMKNRDLSSIDYDNLPSSLKILYNSIQISNDELKLAISKAVQDEKMKTELITNVSHDLKTPLTSIINYVDLLKKCDIQDADAVEYINVLDEKGNKLKSLIDDLIEASKITSGAYALNPVSLDFCELVTQAIVDYQQDFIDNDLELVFNDNNKGVCIFADGNKSFRIVENLLSNAKKYSAKGTRVYADVYCENNYSVFELKNVSSKPLNISTDELKQRFVRGDESRTLDGNGLGLSIADSLCSAMNGKLDIYIDGDLFKVKVLLPKEK